MAKLGELVAYLKADTSGLEKGLSEGERSTKKYAETSSNALANAEKKMLGSFKRIGAAAAAALSVKAVVNYAAEWQGMTETVQRSAGGLDATRAVMAQFNAESIATGTQMQELVRFYNRNELALRSLGVATNDQAKLTRALNSAMLLSGASSQKHRQTLDNVTRALTRGHVAQSELNQIIRDGSVITEVLSSELGKTTSELQEMAREGELTARMISDALIKNVDELAGRSSEMSTSVSDGMSAVSTSVMALIGEFDSAAGASDSLGSALVSLAEKLTPFDDTGNLKDWAQNLHLIKDAAVILAGVLAGRLAQSLYGNIAQFAAAQIQAARYQAALARMAGVSTTAAAGIASAGAAASAAKAAFALVGGPIGAAVLAGTAIMYFSNRSKEAVPTTDELRARIDKLRASMAGMSSDQADAALVDVEKNIKSISEQLKLANLQLETTKMQMRGLGEQSPAWGDLTEKIRTQKGQIADLNEELKDLAETEKGLQAIRDTGSAPTPDEPPKPPTGVVDSIKEQINALERARAQWNMSAGDIAYYDLKLGGATEQQALYAKQLTETVEALSSAKDRVVKLSVDYSGDSIVRDFELDVAAIQRVAAEANISLGNDQFSDSAIDLKAIVNTSYETNIEGYQQAIDDLSIVREQLEASTIPADTSPEIAAQWQELKEAQLQAIDNYSQGLQGASDQLEAMRMGALEFSFSFDDTQQQQLDERVNKIREAYEAEAITQQEYLDAMAAAEGEYNVAIFEHRQALRDNALEFAMTDKERFEEQHERRMERLREALEEEAITRDEFREAELESQRMLNDALQDLEQQAMRAKLDGIQQAMSAASTLMNSESRKMFEIGKMAAIANAVIDTASGVAKAWSLGPILGPPMAALVGAAGLAQIHTIKSTKFGSGSSTPSAGASATPAPQASAAAESQAPAQNVYLHGIERGSMYDGGQILDALNGAIESGGRIVGVM